MIGIIIYSIGVAVQYVRVNTTHKKWKETYLESCRRNDDPAMFHYFAVIGSWATFVIMESKRFLDTKFINKSK